MTRDGEWKVGDRVVAKAGMHQGFGGEITSITAAGNALVVGHKGENHYVALHFLRSESNPLDEPLTADERAALANLILCHLNEPLTHRDQKALAQVAIAARKYMEAKS